MNRIVKVHLEGKSARSFEDGPVPESGKELIIEAALLAAKNSVVAAESPGAGSCRIGDILESKEYLEAFVKDI